jgi:hypothetical protein
MIHLGSLGEFRQQRKIAGASRHLDAGQKKSFLIYSLHVSSTRLLLHGCISFDAGYTLGSNLGHCKARSCSGTTLCVAGKIYPPTRTLGAANGL